MYDGYSCVYGGECVGCRECEADESPQCTECGEEVDDEDELRHGLCKDCQQAAKRAVADCLLKEFGAEDLALVDDALDGVSLSAFLAKNRTPEVQEPASELLAHSLR